MKLSPPLVAALAPLLLCACPKEDAPSQAAPQAASGAASAGGASASGAAAGAGAAPVKRPAAASGAAQGKAASSGAIAWIEDDLDAALKSAKAQGKPVVVDLWAPWCHTCLSMQKFVLPDARITARRDDFVWVALDTDKPKNAAAVKGLPQSFWPTFYALSPDGAVLARHVGSASVEQFLAFLDRAKATGDQVVDLLRQADAAVAAGEHRAAADRYAAALERGGPAWEGRFAVRVSLLESLKKAGDFARCAELGRAHLGDMKAAGSASAADFTYFAVACSRLAKRDDHKVLLELAAAADGPIRTVLGSDDAALTADDKSDALRILREIEDERGNAEEAKKLAEAQAKLLDDAVRALDDPHAQMTFHWPRVEVYTYLKRGEALVTGLERSVKALPGEYDPPYRLAWLLHELGRHDDAVAPAEQAVKLAYGPRKARVVTLLADVHAARKDVAAERSARGLLLKLLQGLPAHQRSDAALEEAKAKLAALPPSP